MPSEQGKSKKAMKKEAKEAVKAAKKEERKTVTTVIDWNDESSELPNFPKIFAHCRRLSNPKKMIIPKVYTATPHSIRARRKSKELSNVLDPSTCL